MNNIRKKIVDVISKVGSNFTFNDISKYSDIKKEDLIDIFHNRNQLYYAALDLYFEKLHIKQLEIVEDNSLELKEKIVKLMYVVPDGYDDFHDVARDMGKKNAHVYEVYVLAKCYESYDLVFKLLDTAVSKNLCKEYSRYVVAVMVINSLQALNLSMKDYNKSKKDIINIVVDGLWLK